uniref:Uncharacterized protein n=1 Tax=Sphaerodactylus townsendi TaxID=933632 RepID=A0ACB8EG95_9SAUR
MINVHVPTRPVSPCRMCMLQNVRPMCSFPFSHLRRCNFQLTGVSTQNPLFIGGIFSLHQGNFPHRLFESIGEVWRVFLLYSIMAPPEVSPSFPQSLPNLLLCKTLGEIMVKPGQLSFDTDVWIFPVSQA